MNFGVHSVKRRRGYPLSRHTATTQAWASAPPESPPTSRCSRTTRSTAGSCTRTGGALRRRVSGCPTRPPGAAPPRSVRSDAAMTWAVALPSPWTPGIRRRPSPRTLPRRRAQDSPRRPCRPTATSNSAGHRTRLRHPRHRRLRNPRRPPETRLPATAVQQHHPAPARQRRLPRRGKARRAARDPTAAAATGDPTIDVGDRHPLEDIAKARARLDAGARGLALVTVTPRSGVSMVIL
jgi:hypothetical protein